MSKGIGPSGVVGALGYIALLNTGPGFCFKLDEQDALAFGMRMD